MKQSIFGEFPAWLLNAKRMKKLVRPVTLKSWWRWKRFKKELYHLVINDTPQYNKYDKIKRLSFTCPVHDIDTDRESSLFCSLQSVWLPEFQWSLDLTRYFEMITIPPFLLFSYPHCHTIIFKPSGFIANLYKIILDSSHSFSILNLTCCQVPKSFGFITIDQSVDLEQTQVSTAYLSSILTHLQHFQYSPFLSELCSHL